jgi:hypothetical protein
MRAARSDLLEPKPIRSIGKGLSHDFPLLDLLRRDWSLAHGPAFQIWPDHHHCSAT